MPSPDKIKRLRNALYRDQDGKCHYCGKDTILPGQLRNEFSHLFPGVSGNVARQPLLYRHPDFLARWNTEGASIEHLTPLAAKGGWGADNLVMACVPCNVERGREFRLTLPEPELSGLKWTSLKGWVPYRLSEI